MPRVDPVHKGLLAPPKPLFSSSWWAQQLHTQPPGAPIGEPPEAAQFGGSHCSTKALLQPPPMPRQR